MTLPGGPLLAAPALNQLMLPFLSLVTEVELHRNPTVEAEHAAPRVGALPGLLLTYPVHQAADILSCRADPEHMPGTGPGFRWGCATERAGRPPPGSPGGGRRRPRAARAVARAR